MKKLFLLFVFGVYGVIASAQIKFDVQTPEGHKLTFQVLEQDENKVEIVKGKIKKGMDLIIPDVVSYEGNDYVVEAIGEEAFKSTKVKNVVLPPTVKYIGLFAFMKAKDLENILLPEGLEVISSAAFFHCIKLQEIRIPSTVQFLGTWAFTIWDGGFTARRCVIKNLPSIVTEENCETCGLKASSVKIYYDQNPEKAGEAPNYAEITKYIYKAEEDEEKLQRKIQRAENMAAISNALSGVRFTPAPVPSVRAQPRRPQPAPRR